MVSLSLVKILASVSISMILMSSAEGRAVSLSKRSDDVLPDMAVVEQLTNRVQTLEASLTTMQNFLTSTQTKVDRLDTTVAFLVSFHANVVSGVGDGVTARFDDVMLNEGNGYNVHTGIFTAPVTGTYALYLKIQTMAGHPHSLNLRHNGHYIGSVYGDDAQSYDMASTLELVHATKGDTFWVTANHNGDFRGSGVTRFAGFLVHAD